MTIDRSDNMIYAVGGYDVHYTSILLKLTTSFNVVYEVTQPNEFFQDVAVRDSENLVVASKVIGNHYTFALENKTDGHQVIKFDTTVSYHTSPGEGVASAIGVAVDNNKDILLSGGIGAIDTLKSHIYLVDGDVNIQT
jgi:hypothetical protein